MSNEFTSRLSKPQAIAVLIWLPLHIIVLPALLYPLVLRGLIGGVTANLLIYALGAVYMLLLLRRFFRRDFDALCDHPLRVLLLVVGAYWASRFGEVLVALLLEAMSVTGSNENNEAVIQMAKDRIGPTAAMAVILAPIVEETCFRGAIFGRAASSQKPLLAYAVSISAFCLYHVWQSAFTTRCSFSILLYLPSSLALAYVYERTKLHLEQYFSAYALQRSRPVRGGCGMSGLCTLRVIARIETDFPDKFGIPRQAGLVEALEGRIVFCAGLSQRRRTARYRGFFPSMADLAVLPKRCARPGRPQCARRASAATRERAFLPPALPSSQMPRGSAACGCSASGRIRCTARFCASQAPISWTAPPSSISSPICPMPTQSRRRGEALLPDAGALLRVEGLTRRVDAFPQEKRAALLGGSPRTIHLPTLSE